MVTVCSSQYVDCYIEEIMNVYDSVGLLYGYKVDLEGGGGWCCAVKIGAIN